MEELKADSIEKETHIAHLQEKVLGLTLSMEKAQEEAIVAFMRSNKFKNRLDHYYVAGYKYFRADAKETYPEVNFDSFKTPTATESSLLLTSSEDVNMVGDASTETAQDATNASKDDPNLGVIPLGVYPSRFIFLLEKFYLFNLLKVHVVLGFTLFFLFFFFFLKIHSSTMLSS